MFARSGYQSWKRQMERDPKVKIQYASKYAGISNAWKKWQGETKGLIRLRAVDKKQRDEQIFDQWVRQDAERVKKYGSILDDFAKVLC